MIRHFGTIILLISGSVYADDCANIEAPYSDEECLNSYHAVAGAVSGMEDIFKRPLENKASVRRSFPQIMDALDKNKDILISCSSFHDHLGLSNIAFQASNLNSIMTNSLRTSASALDEHDTMYKAYARNVIRLIDAIEQSYK